MLDVRGVIGGMFSLLGVLLAGFGLVHAGDPAMRPTGIPITLYWGLVMLAFGLFMLWRGFRAGRP